MTKKVQTKRNKQANSGPVVQQFASGGSAVPTPEVPYDVEKVRRGNVQPAPTPSKDEPEA